MGFNVLLAEGGIWLTFYYLLAFFMALKNEYVRSNKIPFFLFSLLIAMNLFISNVAFEMTMLLIISAGYAASVYRNKKQLRNEGGANARFENKCS